MAAIVFKAVVDPLDFSQRFCLDGGYGLIGTDVGYVPED
jgi:hypothetical protein